MVVNDRTEYVLFFMSLMLPRYLHNIVKTYFKRNKLKSVKTRGQLILPYEAICQYLADYLHDEITVIGTYYHDCMNVQRKD